MAHEQATDQAQTSGRTFVLPMQVFGVVEVRRLSHELETLDDYLRQAKVREGGGKQASLPRASRLLDATASENHLNLLEEADRQKLAGYLQQILEQAPTVHISFASDPSAAFLEKVVSWLRGNIHPLMLIRLGLQPSIAAGCVIRTANRSFDFSLRHRFTEERQLLLYSLEQKAGSAAAPQPAQPQATVQAPVPVAAAPAPAAPATKVEVTQA